MQKKIDDPGAWETGMPEARRTVIADRGTQENDNIERVKRPKALIEDLDFVNRLERFRQAADGAPPLRNQKFADSPLEGAGFEPSVPREAAGILVISVLVRADFSACRESSK
jgi:hypothetical protein